jgi:predicted transcriptional regulator
MDMIELRLPPEIRERLERIAEPQHRTLSNLIEFIILQWLEHEERKDTETHGTSTEPEKIPPWVDRGP